MILSNRHVLAVDNKVSDDNKICHPACSNNIVASLYEAAPIANIDAGIALVENYPATTCQIFKIGAVARDYVDNEEIKVMKNNNARVIKRGAKSNFTSGRISYIGYSGKVGYEEIGEQLITDQLMIDPDPEYGFFSERGDSGSCIIDGSSKRVVALLVGGLGGTSFASPIQNVIETLDIEFS
jgi:hypothetical protein